MKKLGANCRLGRVNQPVWTHGGEAHTSPLWTVQIQRGGERRTYTLPAAGKHEAAAKAAPVYRLVEEGWNAAEKFLHPDLLAASRQLRHLSLAVTSAVCVESRTHAAPGLDSFGPATITALPSPA